MLPLWGKGKHQHPSVIVTWKYVLGYGLFGILLTGPFAPPYSLAVWAQHRRHIHRCEQCQRRFHWSPEKSSTHTVSTAHEN